MYTATLRPGESIMIGVCEVKFGGHYYTDQARLLIRAPKEIAVNRPERKKLQPDPYKQRTGQKLSLIFATEPGTGFLCLTRGEGQSIEIGNDVRVTVTDIRRQTLEIEIIAPPELKIIRKQVYDEPYAQQGHTTPPGRDKDHE